MKAGDLVCFSKHSMYKKKLDIKWGVGLITEIYNGDVEVWWAKIGTSRTIAEDVLEVVS